MITNLKIDEERKRLYYQQGYWTEETLYDVWNRQARACADREYVVDDRGNRYTYAYVDDAAARLASWLKDVGVEEGDVVSFQMPVWAEFCIVYVACLKAGAVMHPLSRAFNERDLRYVLNPKAVLLTHNNLLFSERAFTEELELTSDDVMFMPAPLNHATGFNHGLLSPLLLGGKAVLQEKFDAESAIDLMNVEGVTWSMGATPFIYDLLGAMERTGKRPTKLRFYLCGGAPVPGTMVHRAREKGIVLCEVYGSTESCPHVYVPPAYALGWNGKFSGRPFKGIEVRVVDEQGRDVPTGMQGEELSRGPNVFVGYLGNPEATDEALSSDGWFASGDLCSMDDRGRIRINGRRKEIIIRGGENISAAEVDEAVTGCPGIGSHATIGMPDPRLGERICLFAVASGEARPSVTDVADFLKGRNVQKRLWPERIEYVDRIPMTESGKVKRNWLSDILAERLLSNERALRDSSLASTQPERDER